MQMIDPADSRLDPFRNLPDSALRDDDLFIAEGAWLVERLLQSDVETRAVLTTAARRDEVARWAPEHVPLYSVTDGAMDDIVGFKFHRGVLAAAVRPDNPPLDALLPRDGDATLLICPRITNADNLGSILRTAAAFDVDGVLLGRDGCDLWRRQTVRVSMGAAFALPVRVSDDLEDDLDALRRADVQCVATVLDDRAEQLQTAARPARVALLLGPEDYGLDEQWLSRCDRRVTLPMGAGADSLNVAVAAAVFLYHFTRCARREAT